MPDLFGIGLQRSIRSCPQLQSLEPLDPAVGLTEDPETEDRDHHEQNGDADEGDVQLGADPEGKPPDRAYELIVATAPKTAGVSRSPAPARP